MLLSQRMTKIAITGPRNHRSNVIEELHSLKLMHLIDHTKSEELDIGTPLGRSEHISALLIRVRSLLATFGKTQVEGVAVSDSLDAIENKITTIVSSLTSIQDGIAAIHAGKTEKEQYITRLRLLDMLGLDTTALDTYKHLSLHIGSVTSVDELKKELAKISENIHVTSAQHEDKDYVAVFNAKKREEDVRAVLHKYSFSAFDFGDLTDYAGAPQKNIRDLRVSLDLLAKDLERAEVDLAKLKLEHTGYLLGAEHYLRRELEKAQAPLRFAETNHAFVIRGWVSTTEYRALKQALEKKVHKQIYIKVEETKKGDSIPIVMKNMLFVKPFEFFMHLYTLPNYKELDPSFFMFFTFPFFFGFMLGDVIYGMITFLLFALLWWKLPQGRNILAAMMLCSLVTIVFGFVFGEYLGFEYVHAETAAVFQQYGIPLHEEVIHHETVYSFPRVMNRLHGEVTLMGNTLPTVLVLGAILGFIHINLGLFLGFINEVVSHGFFHAFFAKVSWYILELGIALAVLSGLGMIPLHWGVGLAVMALSVIMLYIGEGVQGIVEIPALLTNILSYLRLGAVALASVGLAVVVNEKLAGPFLQEGGWHLLIALLIMICGHMVNIALGIIGPFLHSLRLHYVEFFSKFYKGGGQKFVAFGEDT